MKLIFNKILKTKRIVFIIVLICFISLFFSAGLVVAQTNSLWSSSPIENTVGKAIATVLGWIAWVIVHFLGLILTLLMKILVNVAQFNKIIDVDAVKIGWAIVRDLCNMFFILILLVIAFATILRIESYSAKRLLPKLLIMAVLINFSKTIFGLIIDFSQVIMLTFVNGFGTYGYNNLVNLFQIQGFLQIWAPNSSTSAPISEWAVVAAIIAAVMAMIITTIVVLVMLAVLVMRVIMLWVYTILSPLVFFGAAFPGGQKYTSRIWEDFIKQVLVGPLLAFFIWLALSTAMNSSKVIGNLTANQQGTGGMIDFCDPVGTDVHGTINKIFCEGSFQTYIITIALLIGGLMVTQQIGGLAGSAAGKGLQWAKRASLAVGGAAAGAAVFIPKQYAKRAGYGAADLALGGIKTLPIVGNLAMEAQAKLKMKRDYAEEKDTRYMKYLPEQDLDEVIRRQRAGGPLSFLARGMESRRQGFKSALTEKMRRGEEWGMDKNTKMRNKTLAMIELAQLAGHSVTAEKTLSGMRI